MTPLPFSQLNFLFSDYPYPIASFSSPSFCISSIVDIAVAAARQAFDHGPWPRMSGFARGRVLMKFADLMDEHAEELAALESIDAGKLFYHGKIAEVPFAANLLRYYAGAADKIHGDVLKMSRELQGYTLLEPNGVVGHIIPWNFPCGLFFSKPPPLLCSPPPLLCSTLPPLLCSKTPTQLPLFFVQRRK